MKGGIYIYTFVILFQLALVAGGNRYLQNFEQLQDELGSEDLIFMSQKPIHNNKSYGGPTTTLPNVGITTHEPIVTELVYEEEWLLPGFAAEEDLLLNRDKRAVVGSGDGAPELNACLGVDNTESLVASTSPTYNDFKTATETAIFDKCKAKATTLSGVEVLDVDVDKSVINFKLVFPSTTDIPNSAQCLRDIQTQGSITIGDVNFQITKDPLIENAANVLVAVVCELCVAEQVCILNVVDVYFCGFSDLYSTSQTDLSLPKEDDSVGTLTTPSQIPIGSSLHNEFFISSNGFLSLVNNPGPQSMLLENADFDILAVAWADLDLKTNGDVFYQAHTNTDPISPETQAVLARASSDVQNFAPKTTFEATTVIIVTWKEIARLYGINTQHATFQLVLASDGFETYALYFYGDNSWAVTSDVFIGFKNNQGSTTNQFSQSSLISGLKSSKGNTASDGIWIYKVGEVSVNYLEKCKAFHAKEASNKNLYKEKNEEVPTCPCSKDFLNKKFVEEISDTNRICYVIDTLDSYSRLCCYEPTTKQFIESDPYSGSLLKYNPLTNRQQYTDEDFTPWNDCCIQISKCQLFRQVRPTKTCSPVSDEALVFGFGDPHITTADGFSYTFNGLGEFTFLQIADFIIQMRAVKVKDQQGNLLDATVFGGFVVSDGNGGKVQIELSNSLDRLVLYVNGRDVSLEFYEQQDYFYVLPNTLSIRRSGTHRVDIVNKNGVTLRLENKLKMLDVGFSIPKAFNSKVVGLVGNYDDDNTNDITFKDGRTLPNDATDKQIFEAGKSWAVAEGESLFIYQNGLTYKDFNDPSFTPIFASDFTAQQRSDGAQVCGGSDKQFCIYDYTVTGDSSLAIYTKDRNLDSKQEISARENQIPTITVNTPQIVAKVNEETKLTLTTSDGDNDSVTVTVVSEPATDFNFNAVSGATWIPRNNDIAQIEFQAQDSNGGLSPLLAIDITLCTLCNGKGTCHASETRNSPVTNYFKLLKCVCVNGYEGEDCETESNGCQYDPCDPLQTCSDKPGSLTDGEAGYTCSDCPSGYTKTNPQKCQDNDECADTTICGTGGTCSNVPGSYKCTCSSGYRLVGQKCQDIDECLDRTDNCEQICENTDGTFSCSCETGFTKNAENCTAPVSSSCTTITDCQYGCKIVDTNDQCFCPSTQVLAADQRKCEDFNECTINICQQKCINKDPGFTCSCQDGFKLAADSLSCEACTELSWGAECSQTCDCNGRGTCSPALGCQCNSMWTGPDCTTDINECIDNPNICPAGFLCRNLAGSHECYCPDGYEEINNECKDVDECTRTMGICTGSNEDCVNNVGSYTCVCATGFSRNPNDNKCEDINECTSGIHGCEQICENNIGSFNCRCRLGFRIKDDRKTCEDDPNRDACANFPPANCEYGCKEQNNQAVCFCQKGYVLGSDGKSCVDVNECDANHGCSDNCVNTPGSFKCTCADYKKLKNDGKTCIACLSSEWGTACENTCDCSAVGSQGCLKETGCNCKAGWTGVKCDQDQDECGISGQCTIAGSVCVNTPGSYQCNCKDGYKLSADKSKCEDIDECSLTPKVCEQTCNNTDGSYYCSCENGFTFNAATNTCDDIDECNLGKSNCAQNCKNTFGSFLCDCNEGYTLNSDRRTCTAETECDVGNGCGQNCAKISGTDTCGCNEGYKLNNDGKTCDVIDRCGQNPCINGTCTSTPPTYTCACALGLQLKNDDVTCEECPEGQYGSNCASTCTCVASNTKSCNKENGACICNDGWKGTTCNENIDECTAPNNHNCASNATCIDTDGSYICQCNSGSVSINGICQACPEGKYGSNCASTCTCVASNTKSCNKQTGACDCNDGWKGTTCNENVNECDVSTTCNSVPNSKCVDSVGSFDCKCDPGYVKGVNGKCEDQNECLSSLNTCTGQNQVCSNTIGSFECKCGDGYFKDGNICKDIDECMVNNNGCEIFCNNTAGSFFCSCPPDQQLNARDSKTCYATADETKEVYQIRLDINDKDDIVNNKNLYAHEKLKKDIGDAVLKSIQSVSNTGVFDVNVTNLRLGSIIADMDVIAVQFQNLNASVLSKQFYDLLQAGELVIDGSSTKVLGITKDGTTLTSSSSQCEIRKEVKSCDSKTEICEVQNDRPVCRPVSETSTQDLALIIGLSVGIPLGFLLLAGLTCCIFFCVKRNRNKSQGSDRVVHSEPRDPFMSVFSGQVPKRGGWAANRYGLYSPDTLSAASQASSDSDGKLIKGRQKPGRMDFNDSAWNDNRSFSVPSGPQDGTQANFSWEHMFRALEPMRNFEIQRPNVQSSPVYPIRGRRPDSMA